MAADTIEIAFVKGIQSAGDESALTEPGKLTLAYNVHIRPEHADVLHVRPGIVRRTVDSTDVDTSHVRPSVIDGRPFVTTPKEIYQETATPGTYRNLQTVAQVSITDVEKFAPVTRGSRDNIRSAGYAEHAAGPRESCVFVWSTGSVQSTPQIIVTTGGVRVPPEGISAVNPVNFGSVAVFAEAATGGYVFVQPGNGVDTIELWRRTTPTAGLGSIGILATARIFDAQQSPDGLSFAVLYRNTGTNRLVLYRSLMNGTGTSSVNVTAAGPTTPTWGCISMGNSDCIVWHGGYTADNNTIYAHKITGVSTARGSSTQALGLAAHVVARGVASKLKTSLTAGGSSLMSYCYIVGGVSAATNLGRLWSIDDAAAGNVSTANAAWVGAIRPQGSLWTGLSFIGARIVGYRGRTFGMWQAQIVANDVARVLAYHSVSLAEDWPIDDYGFYIGEGGTYYAASIVQSDQRCVAMLHNLFGSVLHRVTFERHIMMGDVVQHGGFPLMLSGAPRYFDGNAFAPAGIPQEPRATVTVQGAGGFFGAGASPSGDPAPLGTYVYAIIFEWFDARGRRQQSAPSIHTVVISVVNSRVLINVDPISFPLDERVQPSIMIHGRPLTLIVYRNDGVIGNTITTRSNIFGTVTCSDLSGAFAAGAAYVLPFDNGEPILHNGTGEPLYTAGGAGEREDTALEATLFARGYSDRFLTVHPLFSEQLQYTKTIEPGRAIEPNQAFTFTLPQPITGLAIQDGNVYCFSVDNVWGVSPSFADDTGANPGVIDPVPLSNGIGCTQPASIVETPTGVFFMGPRGPYQIARGGGAPQYIGLDVERYFLDWPVVTGVAHNAQTHEVAWALTDTGLTDYRQLVYNYHLQQWFLWRSAVLALTSNNPFGGLTCIPARGFLAAARNTTSVYVLDSDDNSSQDIAGIPTSIAVEIQTTDFRSDNIGEMWRVLRAIVAPVTSMTLSIAESHDSGATWPASQSIAVSPANMPVIYQLATQKTRGVRLRITCMAGFSKLSGISLVVARLGRAYTRGGLRRG